MTLRLFLALLLAALLLPGAFAADAPAARIDHGRIPRAAAPPRIDGSLDDAAWHEALAIEVPYEIFPGDNVAAPVRTTCLLTFDDHALYVAFRAQDPEPGKIRAHLADRDSVFRNDYVGLVIDPFNDGRRGFNFMANPLGVQMDASISDVGGSDSSGFQTSAAMAPAEDFSWDAIWDAAGKIDADGYAVEMAIPFAALRFPRAATEQTWGVLPFRAYPRDVMHRLHGVRRDRNRNCYFCQLGTMTGLAGMTPGRGFEIIPTLTAARTDERASLPDAPLEKGHVQKDLGVSLRWGVTPNLSLNAAVNPDFSQVEADARKLSVNRRFALFYPEKRPFFLEGADFFNTSLQVFHSRAIADPAWGAKLTGKEGPNALGVVVARDRLTNVIYPGAFGSSSGTLEQENTTTVLRWRRDVGATSALGVLATDREGERYHNRVVGADGYFRLGERDTLAVQYLVSSTRYPDAAAREFGQPRESFDGHAVLAWYEHSERNWAWWANLMDRTARFRADTGFVPRVDVRGAEVGAMRTVWADGKRWYNRLRFALDLNRNETHRGEFASKSVDFEASYDGPLQSTIDLEVYAKRDAWAGRSFDTSGVYLFFNIRPTGNLTTDLSLSYHRDIDAAAARGGRVSAASLGVTYNLGRRLYAELNETVERFERDGDWLYRAQVTRLRLVEQFTVRLFVRATLQYTRVDRNPALAGPDDLRRDEGLFGQYLVSYKINPQTLFYAGYSDTRLGTENYSRTLADRTFFIKLGYAWVL